jgi:hypothetical protein
MDEIIEKLETRLQELKTIYRENGKTDFDAGKVAGLVEALELIAEMAEV